MARAEPVVHEKPLSQSSRGFGNSPLRRKHQSANDQFSHCRPTALHANHRRGLQTRHLFEHRHRRRPRTLRTRHRRDWLLRDLQSKRWRVALVGKRRHFLKHAGRCLLCKRLALYRNSRRSRCHPVCLEQSLFGPAHDTRPEGGADGLHRRRENQQYGDLE
jgi:hypothetical protein